MSGGRHSPFDIQVAGWESESRRWNKYPQEVLPLWVADMDFQVAEPIRRALATRVEQFPFWYSEAPSKHNQIVAEYLERSYQWKIHPDWVVWVPGVMVGIYQYILGLPEDTGIVCQTPVYKQLHYAAQLRQEIQVPMSKVHEGSRRGWACEFTHTTVGSNAEILLLCHPHNPTGWVADSHTLSAIGNYAKQHDMLVISDEIHAGLVLDGKHQPFAVACPEYAESTLTFMSASKTWNIAGLHTAFAVVPNSEIRNRLRSRLAYCGELGEVGVLATITALKEGEEWRQELLAYLRTSRDMIDSAIGSIDGLDWIPNQAMYLGWIDCRGLGDNAAVELHRQLLKEGLALLSGQDFGDSQYLRINYATSHSRLDLALDLLRRVCNRW